MVFSAFAVGHSLTVHINVMTRGSLTWKNKGNSVNMSDYLSIKTITRDMHTQLKRETRFYKPCTTDSNNQRLPNRGKQYQGASRSCSLLLRSAQQDTLSSGDFKTLVVVPSFWASRLYQQKGCYRQAGHSSLNISHYEPEIKTWN